MAIGISLKIIYKKEIKNLSGWRFVKMVLILIFTVIKVMMKIMMMMTKKGTHKRGLSIHTSFPRAVKQIKSSVYSFPVR